MKYLLFIHLYDRYIVGGAMPVSRELALESADELKSENFLDRREMGIINVGGDAVIKAGDQIYEIGFKEALYLGKGTRNVVFKSVDPLKPAKLYINSAPAHHAYRSKKVTLADAESSRYWEILNHRTTGQSISFW